MQNCPPCFIYQIKKKKETHNSMFLQNFFKFLKKASDEVRERRPSALPVSAGLCRQFSLDELQVATNNFDDDLKIGDGFLGRVYKGIIDGGTLVVAVKRLSGPSSELAAFRNEVQVLCQLRHQNLVSLIGFCYEKDERILVYELMSYGSLYSHLFRNAYPLPWKRRLEICIAAARGLHYLHTNAKYAIIHRNFNPRDILLNENWDAKLSNFGLSKIGPSSISKPNPKALEKKIALAGTSGYIAPECIGGELSVKADVFSLGVVLLEVLCSRRMIDDNYRAEEVNLFFEIIKCVKNGCVHDMIDPFLKGKIAPACLIEFMEIALSCIHPNPNERPSMGEVEVTLELALELQEKADLVIDAVNPHAGYTYEDISFRVSFADLEEFYNKKKWLNW